MSEIARSFKQIFWPGEKHTGKPVYLQETGEKLGRVVDAKRDENHEVVSYLVDCDGVELDISCENILKDKDGFIYRPVWLTEAEDVIRRLETQQRINPDLATYSSETMSPGEVKKLVSRSSLELKKTFEEAKDIAQLLSSKRNELQQKKDIFNHEIEEMAKKRMRGEGSRKNFAESIVSLKRKAKIVEENLNKVQSLYSRLEDSPLIDLESIKKRVDYKMPDRGNTYVKEASNPQPDLDDKSQHSSKRKLEEGERIKKIRIPKLEQEFEQKEVELQNAYISDLKDRVKHINKDIKDLRQLAKENEGDEKIEKFIDKKMENLKAEKKALADRIKEVKKGRDTRQKSETEENPAADTKVEGVLEQEDTDDLEITDEKRINGAVIARLGSLIIIIGFIVLLILSLLQVF